MLKDSGLLEDLERNAFSPITGEAMCIYGDPAYPLRLHLQQPFREAPLTAPMEQFNKSMSSVRTSVEWIFGDIVASFKFLDFKKNLKIGLSAVGKHYVVSTLLRNALTCMYGNTTATFFNIEPPSLEEYFAWNYNLILWWHTCKNNGLWYPLGSAFLPEKDTKPFSSLCSGRGLTPFRRVKTESRKCVQIIVLRCGGLTLTPWNV